MLAPTQRLTGVHKEWHTRKQQGQDVCYVATDRLGEWTVITQKLPLLAAWINDTLGDEPGARVSTTALYHGVGREDSRVGAWVKGRWKVRAVGLDRATDEFNSERRGMGVVVAAEPTCYVVRA